MYILIGPIPKTHPKQKSREKKHNYCPSNFLLRKNHKSYDNLIN